MYYNKSINLYNFMKLITPKRLYTSSTVTNSREFKEVKIKVPWGWVAGKWWEPYHKEPVLTLHGWQDNCGSFDTLIPLLTRSIGFLTIDFPGHGYSSRLPPGIHYDSFNYYSLLIKRIMDHYKWDKVNLMGHSLGGISSYVYGMLFPETVNFLVAIEGLKPLMRGDKLQVLKKNSEEFLKYDRFVVNNEDIPKYTIEEIRKNFAALNNNSIDINKVDYILNRNIQLSSEDSSYYFTRDPRIKAEIFWNWHQSELVQYAERITFPLLAIKADQSGYFEQKRNFDEVFNVIKNINTNCNAEYVRGTHHVHLNNPEVVSEVINKFLAKF